MDSIPKKKPRLANIFVFLRILIGSIFLISGFEKLIQPSENFLFVIQGYDVLRNGILESLVARIFPWVELILGIFVILGLWTRFCLSVLLLLTTSLILIVGQAILRRLPITECGCFGDLLKVPLPVIVKMDLTMWIVIVLLLIFKQQTFFLSLDKYFLKEE